MGIQEEYGCTKKYRIAKCVRGQGIGVGGQLKGSPVLSTGFPFVHWDCLPVFLLHVI